MSDDDLEVAMTETDARPVILVCTNGGEHAPIELGQYTLSDSPIDGARRDPSQAVPTRLSEFDLRCGHCHRGARRTADRLQVLIHLALIAYPDEPQVRVDISEHPWNRHVVDDRPVAVVCTDQGTHPPRGLGRFVLTVDSVEHIRAVRIPTDRWGRSGGWSGGAYEDRPGVHGDYHPRMLAPFNRPTHQSQRRRRRSAAGTPGPLPAFDLPCKRCGRHAQLGPARMRELIKAALRVHEDLAVVEIDLSTRPWTTFA